MSEKYGIGVSIPRADAEYQVTGKSRYGADIDMPNMLICKILRPKYASAKILKIDTSEAEKLPGVVAIVTEKDVPFNMYGVTTIDQPFFIGEGMNCFQFGDMLAAVAAESEDIAEKAVSLIRVEYEELPCVSDVLEAMKPESYKVHGGDSNIFQHLVITNGDIDKGFEEAKWIIDQDFSTPGLEHCSIEPHAGISYIDETTGELVIRSSVQKPFELATDIAKMLKIPMSKIHVLSSSIGGGFGGKNEPTMEPAIALLTLKTRRPVRCSFTREEEFNASTIRHPYKVHYRTGIRADGKLCARSVEIISDSGAYISWGSSTLTKASVHACGPYDIPNTRVDGYIVYTNNPVGGAMRGFGVTQLGFAYEAHTDWCARQIGMDPIEFRRLNLIHDGSQLPTGMIMNIVTVEDCMDKAIEMAKEEGNW